MANFASINSEFSDKSDLESTFKIRFVNATRAIDLTFTWVCKSLRTAAFEYTQGADGGDQGDKSFQAVNTDITSSSIASFMNVSVFIDAFEIEANEYGWVITDAGGVGTSNITLTEVPEVVPVKNFELTGSSLSEAVAPCVDIQVTITENDGVPPYSWITPSSASTTLVADVARAAGDQLITITLEDSETDQASLLNVAIPRIFTDSEIVDIGIVSNPGGLDATVTVLMDTQDFGTYLYSIDGENFQVSNIFTNIVDGDYTLSVNDGYGCVVTTPFTVALPTADNYFRIAKLNAVEFKVPDNKRANLNNTLFNDMQLPNRVYRNNFCQPYFDNEILPIQFQSNFTSHTVQVIDYFDKSVLATITPIIVYDSPENFQYWEFTINLSLFTGSTIQVTVVPDGEVLGGGLAAKSEPLNIISEDPGNEYVKVEYKSNTNNSDIYWNSGFAPFIYVRGQVANALPQINKEISEDCEWNLNTQSRELKRMISFQVYQQPYYIYEKLIWALGNGQGKGDFYLVNDVSVNSEDAAFEEPDFPDKYSLADSEAKLQERNVFTGDLSTTPTPVETVNYLLVNPDNDGGLLVSPDDEITFV